MDRTCDPGILYKDEGYLITMLRQITRLKNHEIIHLCLKISTILTFVFANLVSLSYASNWQPLTKGLEYQDIGANFLTPWAHIHVFRISLDQYQIQLFSAKEISQRFATIDALAEKSDALIAINGGFFDHTYHPLGLRVSQKQELNPIKRISWWGIFTIKDNIPHISSLKKFHYDNTIDFAIQSGPRLIINRHIPHLKPGIAERSAIGITKNNKIILLVTDNAMITTNELANLMLSPPLNCSNALNLDGGSSSQLVSNIGKHHLIVHGLSKLSDAVIVRKKAS